MTRGLLVFGALLLPAAARADGPDPQSLARRIDALLSKEHQAHKVQAAPRADDAEFVRRISLDLIGRIPKVSEVREFLSDRDPEKRSKLITALLDSPRHARHFAATWRGWLAPEITANGEARVFQQGFEGWLYQTFRSRTGHDQLVFELLTVPIASEASAAEVVLRDLEKPNPLAFYAVKDAKPENLAAVTTRLFLGIQLECAQCHDHPFARWTRQQFWNQAAFFAGIERQGRGLYQPLTETVGKREVNLPASPKTAAAVFLHGQRPKFTDGVSSRTALATWVTAPENPFFARATVNRLWGQFFGIGIVEPVDNFHDENPPSHPELLDELAEAFVKANFDMNYLVKAICLTDAYQRSSARSHASQDNPRLFARMGVKALTGEQFYDSLALATGYREVSPGVRGKKGGVSPRSQFLTQFALRGSVSEPETSIQQALALMHGRFATEATTERTSMLLAAVAGLPRLQAAERIEILYLATLSRPPSPRELTTALDFVVEKGKAREREGLADVFWALLNSTEFRLNH